MKRLSSWKESGGLGSARPDGTSVFVQTRPVGGWFREIVQNYAESRLSGYELNPKRFPRRIFTDFLQPVQEKMLKTAWLTAALALTGASGFAQTDTTSIALLASPAADSVPPVRLDGNYVRSYWHDAKALAAQPFRWRGRDWRWAGTIAGAATLSYFFFDKSLQEAAQTHRNDFTNAVSAVADPLGNGRYFWVAPGALVLHGQVFRNPKTTRVGLLILESQLLSGAVVQALKFGLGRKRPYESGSPHDWVGPSLTDFHAFPSGHSQAAFALATVVAMEFRHARAVPPVVYGLASLTALSRLNANAHWVSDVIVGSALGHFIAKTIVRRHPEKGRLRPDCVLFIDPMGRPGVVWRF